MLAPAFLVRRWRGIYCLWLGVAISFGLAVGITRIVQGRHFPSDILWSAGIVYLSAVTIYYAVGLHRETAWSEAMAVDARDERVSIPIRPYQTIAPFHMTSTKRSAA